MRTRFLYEEKCLVLCDRHAQRREKILGHHMRDVCYTEEPCEDCRDEGYKHAGTPFARVFTLLWSDPALWNTVLARVGREVGRGSSRGDIAAVLPSVLAEGVPALKGLDLRAAGVLEPLADFIVSWVGDSFPNAGRVEGGRGVEEAFGEIEHLDLTAVRERLRGRLVEHVRSHQLSALESEVFQRRFALVDGAWSSLDEVGERMKVTRDKVACSQVRALWKLRKSHDMAMLLRAYLRLASPPMRFLHSIAWFTEKLGMPPHRG